MVDWLNGLVEILKLAGKPRALRTGLVFCLVAAVVCLKPPEALANWFDLTDLVKSVRPYAAGILVLSMSGLVTQLFMWGCDWWSLNKKWNKKVERLLDLTTHEKAILQGYFDKDTRTALVSYADGISIELARAGILEKIGDNPTAKGRFPYAMNYEVRKYLKKNPHLLRSS